MKHEVPVRAPKKANRARIGILVCQLRLARVARCALDTVWRELRQKRRGAVYRDSRVRLSLRTHSDPWRLAPGAFVLLRPVLFEATCPIGGPG